MPYWFHEPCGSVCYSITMTCVLSNGYHNHVGMYCLASSLQIHGAIRQQAITRTNDRSLMYICVTRPQFVREENKGSASEKYTDWPLVPSNVMLSSEPQISFADNQLVVTYIVWATQYGKIKIITEMLLKRC